MLFIFKSSASGDVIMLEKNGAELLSVLGKPPSDAKGIITVEQLPGAIATIKAAIEADKAARREPAENEEEDKENASSTIRLSQRALPFLELLERSLKDEVSVTWGV